MAYDEFPIPRELIAEIESARAQYARAEAAAQNAQAQATPGAADANKSGSKVPVRAIRPGSGNPSPAEIARLVNAITRTGT